MDDTVRRGRRWEGVDDAGRVCITQQECGLHKEGDARRDEAWIVGLILTD